MSLEVVPKASAADVQEVLATLPAWFGIPAANEQYVADASSMRGWTVRRDGRTVGVTLVAERNAVAPELHLIAVRPESHRGGAGRLLVESICSALRAEGHRMICVHTVGPSFADEGYARTRLFYEAMDFVPLIELQGVDWDGPTLILARAL